MVHKLIDNENYHRPPGFFPMPFLVSWFLQKLINDIIFANEMVKLPIELFEKETMQVTSNIHIDAQI